METVYAYCELKGSRGRKQWVIIKCPFCGEPHYHGSGGPTDDPMQFLGDRAPHCASPIIERLRQSYCLTTDRALDGTVVPTD